MLTKPKISGEDVIAHIPKCVRDSVCVMAPWDVFTATSNMSGSASTPRGQVRA